MSILSLHGAARQVLVKAAKALVLPVAFIALWAVASQQNWVDPKLIPSPWLVLQKAVTVLQQPNFLTGFGESLARNFIGYGIGAIAGVLFGILIASSRLSNWLFAPSFHVLRQISLFAWLPLISTFLGEGHGAKVLFITLSVFYPVALHTFEGVSSISHKYREVAEVYQFPKTYAFRKLILPGASAQIFVGLQLGLIFAWLATIGSEFLLANYGNGLGNIVIQGRQAFDVELIIFGMLLIGIVGVLLNTVLTWVERKVLAWQQVG
ncbi:MULTISPECIES: ABC transporter permease [unclassified Acinetobacter]|uniref:ABC transporter permease n=1 Tax=unclassified Acinetobacter TaxID=196816 RepID=UPI0015D2E35A|nr:MULTISPECIES: ABC transporter permease [unclassified Acinetobacter]